MAWKQAQGAGEYFQHYPRVPALLTAHARGRDNAMACAWHTSISFSPPLFGVSVSPKRFTFEFIKESGEFGVNFVPYELAELIASIGGCTGREVDKFARYNLVKVPALKTSVPILKNAYAAYECKLVEQRTLGDHEWLVGEIVASHWDEAAFTAEGFIDLDRITPALYIGAERYLPSPKGPARHLDRKVYGKR